MAQQNLTPFEATHPGTLIKDELDLRDDLKQKDLAKEMGVKASFLNEIIKGKRPITADCAVILEKILGIPADYWMRFQSQYEIDKARIKEKNIERIKNVETWGIIKEYVPVKYFNKQKYFTDSLESDIQTVKEIYDISTIDELVAKASENKFAFYRKSDKLTIDEKNMFAWSSLAAYEAKKQKVNTFNPDNINQLCISLKKVFFENNDTIENTKKVLSQYGIKFVKIEKLEKTPIDGYSFWSDDNPAIALTLRHNRIDNFAFTILHEIAHIDLHLKADKEKKYIHLFNVKDKSIAEKEADKYAELKLIPENVWADIQNNLPLNDTKIIKLGNKHNLNPAILLGKVRFEMNYYARKTIIDKKLN